MEGVRKLATFFRLYLTSPNVIGAVAPSSTYLAQRMVEWLEWENAGAVIEYGPGTGSFTSEILKRARSSCKYVGIEINPVLARIFRQRFPLLTLYEDSVANVKSICEKEGIKAADCIICGLPWAFFSASAQTQFLEAMMTVLRPGGQFVTFAYLQGLLLPAGQRFRSRLRQYFSHMSTSRTVWLNVPPAFVYRCRR